jgi:hypothetical protein
MLTRLWASILAFGIGWGAAMVVTLPMALFKVWTNALGGWGPLLWSLGAGAAVWLLWTLAITAGAFLFGALPAIMFVREEWLLRYKGRVMAISAALAMLVVLIRFQFWLFVLPEYYFEPWLFTLYSLLLGVFAPTAAAAYLRLIGRRRAAETRDSAPL